MNKQRYLLVVSGPSGAGKDTVVSRMMQKHILLGYHPGARWGCDVWLKLLFSYHCWF